MSSIIKYSIITFPMQISFNSISPSLRQSQPSAQQSQLSPHQNQLQMEKKNIKSLLSQFRKTKMNCLQLCEKLNKELPNLQKYEIMEVTCTRKIESMDIIGVIKLKKQLINSMAQITVMQKQMTHKIHKNSFKKAIIAPIISNRQIINNEELGPFQIPSYNSKDEENQKKIDRLSSFILSLSRSMNYLQRCMKGQWQEQQFYKYEPQYLQTIRKVQAFKMRDEELTDIARRNFQKYLCMIIQNGEKINSSEQNKPYIVKISKEIVQELEWIKRKKEEDNFYAGNKIYGSESKKKNALMMGLQKINQQKSSDNQKPEIKLNQHMTIDLQSNCFQKPTLRSRMLNDIQGDNDQQNGNYVYMIKKLSPESKLNSSMISSISSLRSLRRKVFDDDIWEQFQKI